MDFARHVKSSVDIVNVVGEFVRLRKQGATRYVGLCPFHTEKTPSFSVHAGLQFFKCFGCGKGGDVFNFLMEIEGVSFFEALKGLAERQGIPLPRRGVGEMADEEARQRAALYGIHETAQRFFAQHLESPEGAAARAYLDKRGLPAEVAREFGLGLAPAGGERLVRVLEREGCAPEQMERSGLAVKRQEGAGYYDRFRNRLVFPIRNETGKLVAFGGRALEADQQPKYLNSPESPIYRKSHVLYNLDRAREAIRKRERAVLVEGYMDAIGVWRAGVKEVVASCGTSLTADQTRMIGRYTRMVTVNFDPDAAGRSAAERSILLLLDEGLHARVLSLPEGLDPDAFCRERGAAAYEGLLEQAPSYYFWLADRARAQHDTRTAEGRVAAFQSLLPAVNRVGNKIERVALVNDLANRLGVEAGLVLESFRKAAAERRVPTAAAAAVNPLKPGERLLVRLLVENEEGRRELLEPLRESGGAEELASTRIFRALFLLAGAGEPFDLMAIEARLEEPDRRLLHEVVFSDAAEAPTIEQGRAALRALQAAAWEARRRILQKEIQEAQNSADGEKVARLVRLKQEHDSRRPQPAAAAAQVSH